MAQLVEYTGLSDSPSGAGVAGSGVVGRVVRLPGPGEDAIVGGRRVRWWWPRHGA